MATPEDLLAGNRDVGSDGVIVRGIKKHAPEVGWRAVNSLSLIHAFDEKNDVVVGRQRFVRQEIPPVKLRRRGSRRRQGLRCLGQNRHKEGAETTDAVGHCAFEGSSIGMRKRPRESRARRGIVLENADEVLCGGERREGSERREDDQNLPIGNKKGEGGDRRRRVGSGGS